MSNFVHQMGFPKRTGMPVHLMVMTPHLATLLICLTLVAIYPEHAASAQDKSLYFRGHATLESRASQPSAGQPPLQFEAEIEGWLYSDGGSIISVRSEGNKEVLELEQSRVARYWYRFVDDGYFFNRVVFHDYPSEVFRIVASPLFLWWFEHEFVHSAEWGDSINDNVTLHYEPAPYVEEYFGWRQARWTVVLAGDRPARIRSYGPVPIDQSLSSATSIPVGLHYNPSLEVRLTYDNPSSFLPSNATSMIGNGTIVRSFNQMIPDYIATFTCETQVQFSPYSRPEWSRAALRRSFSEALTELKRGDLVPGDVREEVIRQYLAEGFSPPTPAATSSRRGDSVLLGKGLRGVGLPFIMISLGILSLLLAAFFLLFKRGRPI